MYFLDTSYWVVVVCVCVYGGVGCKGAVLPKVFDELCYLAIVNFILLWGVYTEEILSIR